MTTLTNFLITSTPRFDDLSLTIFLASLSVEVNLEGTGRHRNSRRIGEGNDLASRVFRVICRDTVHSLEGWTRAGTSAGQAVWRSEAHSVKGADSFRGWTVGQ